MKNYYTKEAQILLKEIVEKSSILKNDDIEIIIKEEKRWV
jgi:hypothetical protein